MSEVARLYKNIESLSRSDIRIVADYVGKIISKKTKNSARRQKKIDLSKYQSVGKAFNMDASDYIEELRNEW
jgi:hypothetical protein